MSDALKTVALYGFALAFLLPFCSFLWHVCPQRGRCRGKAALGFLIMAGVCMGGATGLWLVYVEDPNIVPVSWIILPPALVIRFSVDFSAPVLILCNCTLLVSCWVHMYSVDYMKEDKRLAPYFAMLGLFTTAMLGLFVSGNLWSMALCWGWIGICSYVLIGHNYQEKGMARAATEAFLIGKVGDIGLWVGMLVFLVISSGLDIETLQLYFGDSFKQQVSGFMVWVGLFALCFVWAALSKSAQFPFQVWLISAMRGPVPVSALLHSATLVAAGVFLLGRLAFLFTPWVREVLLVVGLGTALTAGLAAYTQVHIKRLLAYSTISQMGFMVALVALGQVAYAFLYIVLHAIAKALLFLATGIITQQLARAGLQKSEELSQMSGLWRQMPLPYIASAAGAAVLLGLPLSAGYGLKEYFTAQFWGYGGWGLPVAGLALLSTGLYLGRLMGYLFLKKSPQVAQSSAWCLGIWQRPWLQLPLWMGSFCCLGVGYQYPKIGGKGWLWAGMQEVSFALDSWEVAGRPIGLTVLSWGSVGAALLAAGYAARERPRPHLGNLGYRFIHHHGYLHWIYERIYRGIHRCARIMQRVERYSLAPLGAGLAKGLLLLALGTHFVDKQGLSGGLKAAARSLYRVGRRADLLTKQHLPRRMAWVLFFGLCLLWTVLLLFYF